MRIFWFFLVASTCVASPIIEEGDREILRPFFKWLVTKETLGYVLLGEKPAVLIGYVEGLSWEHPISSLGGLIPYFSKGNQREKKPGKFGGNIHRRFLSGL